MVREEPSVCQFWFVFLVRRWWSWEFQKASHQIEHGQLWTTLSLSFHGHGTDLLYYSSIFNNFGSTFTFAFQWQIIVKSQGSSLDMESLLLGSTLFLNMGFFSANPNLVVLQCGHRTSDIGHRADKKKTVFWVFTTTIMYLFIFTSIIINYLSKTH